MPLLHNYVLMAALIAWGIAQIIKVPIEYIQTYKWNWALFIQAGGMPSSHTALVVGVAHGIGLSVGFDLPYSPWHLPCAWSLFTMPPASDARQVCTPNGSTP